MIEVAKSIIQKENKCLLLKRSSSSKFFPELWDFPGGKINPGEEVKEAVIRETEEETSLIIVPSKKVGDYHYTEHDTPIHFQIFSIISFNGEVKLSEDHSDFKWVSEQNLNKYNLAPIVKLFFKLI
jgi:8-oxo-dGTP diphosphatase